MLIRIPRPHRRVIKTVTTFSELNRWASDVDMRIDEILRCLQDAQRILNNLTVTNAPATFLVSSCTTYLGADSGCFRRITLINSPTYGAELRASSTFPVNKITLSPPTGNDPLVVDATAVRRTNSDFLPATFMKGLVLVDGQATPHFWRFRMSTDGIPYGTDIGTGAP